MKPTNLVVPKLFSDGGRVTWSKHQGELVATGDPLFEVDLGYTTAAVRAPCAGRITQILVPDGGEVRDGTTVGLLDPGAYVEGWAPIEICESCGVVRMDRTARCPRCHGHLGSQARQAPRAGWPMWVSVECTFKCRACGFDVPLNHLDMDGGVECARCGLEQAFEVRSWHEALDHAHAVADDQIDGMGKNKILSRKTITKDNAFTITASPGHPVCQACHALLDVALSDAGRATATCATCKTRDEYAVPQTALRMMSGALRAVIAAEHRADRAAAKVQQSAGAVAVSCPSCGAALDVTGEAKFVQCKFCNTTARIPTHAWFRLSGKTPKAEPLWLGFEGPSRDRRDADHERAQRAAKTLYDRVQRAKDAAVEHQKEQEARAALAERLREAKAHGTPQPDGGVAKAVEQVAVVPQAASVQAAATPVARSGGTRVALVVVGLMLLVAAVVTVALAVAN